MYNLKNVSKIYYRKNREIKALNNLDLKIEDQDFVLIKGESGSGKSTLLSLMAGIQGASSGKIVLDNMDLGHLSEKEITKLLGDKISYIPQGYSLLANLTVLDNIRLSINIKNEGRDKTDIKEIIKVLKELKISDLIRAYPDELSGGEQKRVAIARAILQNTSIILADEPTADLDKESSQIIWSIFEKVNLDGKTIVVVTHDEEVDYKGKKVIKLEKDQI